MSVSGRSGTCSFSASSAPNSTAAAESSPASMSGWSGETAEPSTSITSSSASSSAVPADSAATSFGVAPAASTETSTAATGAANIDDGRFRNEELPLLRRLVAQDKLGIGDAAFAPAELARGRLEDGARGEQDNRGWPHTLALRDLVDHAAQRQVQLGRAGRRVWPKLRHDHEQVFAAFRGHREGGTTARPENIRSALRAHFDIMRVQRAAFDGQHVLDAADNVEPALPDEAQIARAQLGQLPVASGDGRPAQPNLTDGAIGQLLARLVVHDLDHLVGEGLGQDVVAARLEDGRLNRPVLRHRLVANPELAAVDL
eukprot:scaffold36275_cov154-Isochrysis_galbana.AAC.4